MLDCRRCKNWQDESFAQLYRERSSGEANLSVFYGCKIYGALETFQREECVHYQEAKELFGICAACGIAVPKICLSLGECVNCTDTDLYCVENCHGEAEKKFCTHYQRLVREGHTLIENNECFELYPSPEAPAPKDQAATPIIPIISSNKKHLN
jgi:hypothetical protein